MKRDSISEGMKSSKTYEVLEAIVREKVQEFIQDILEEEVSDIRRPLFSSFFLLTFDLGFGILSQRRGVGGRQEGNLPDKESMR